jgi:hypothetical protein
VWNDGDGRSGAEVGRLFDFLAQLFARLLLEHVEVAVGADLEHLGADLHARTGGCTNVEVDSDSHVPLLVIPRVGPIVPAGESPTCRQVRR